jgi:signal transduction histidine kinase
MRLSRAIHDTLLQGLVGATLQFDAVAHDLGSSGSVNEERFIRLRKNLQSYIREARHAIWDLRSPRLVSCDLTAALREVCEEATSDLVSCDFSVKGSRHLCLPNVEENLLRIGHEAVTNAVRHANANQVRVELEYEESAVRLRISDNGSGFDPSRLQLGSRHYGLISMKERASAIGGDFKISSRIGQGTEIETVVPVSSHG